MAIGSGEISKREALLVLIVFAFIGLGVAYWMIPYATTREELASLSARVESLDRINQRARADLATGGVQELKAEAEEYTALFGVLRQLVPESNEVPTLLEQISTAARREGLEISAINPQPLLAGPEFDTHQYKISVTGGYHSVARFLTNVGSLSRIVTAVDVEFRDRDATGGSNPASTRSPNSANVAADFMIRTYVARTDPLTTSSFAGGNQ
jgi:type IV pilus assembly protein PilO